MENVYDVREKYMTAPQAAEYLGLTRNRVGRLCIDGRFAGAVKIGRNWIIPREAVENFQRLKPGVKSKTKRQKAEDEAMIAAVREQLKGAVSDGERG